MPDPNQFKIAEHYVSEVTCETAKVGCTKVTRADVEKLLKEMDAAAKTYDFDFQVEWQDDNYLTFNIRCSVSGWVGVAGQADALQAQGPAAWGWESLFLCLQTKHAEKLFNFLGERLGKGLYRIEYTEGDGVWKTSKNTNTRGIYPFAEATRRAAEEERTMGGYRYRVVLA